MMPDMFLHGLWAKSSFYIFIVEKEGEYTIETVRGLQVLTYLLSGFLHKKFADLWTRLRFFIDLFLLS